MLEMLKSLGLQITKLIWIERSQINGLGVNLLQTADHLINTVHLLIIQAQVLLKDKSLLIIKPEKGIIDKLLPIIKQL